MDPYDNNIYLILGGAYFKTGNFSQAEKILLQGIELFPENGDLYVQLGTVYENRNRLSKAAAVLKEALTKKDTNRPTAYNNLGIVYWRMKNYQQSVSFAKQALATDPDFLDAYLTLGITYEDMGYQEQAFAQFRKGWEKGLDMVAIYYNWADNYIKMNQLNRAIIYLKEAVILEPGRPEIHEKLATAYIKKGLFKEAENEKRRAAEIRAGK